MEVWQRGLLHFLAKETWLIPTEGSNPSTSAMEDWQNGIATVLKTVVPKGRQGSNPWSSAHWLNSSDGRAVG